MKELIMLGGPNGAGKTTAAMQILPKFLGMYEFVNADEIARGISPLAPSGAERAAGILMIERMNYLLRRNESFAFETTCAGRGYARFIKLAKEVGYRFTLVFLWLPDPETAIRRVAKRVSEGGHFVPEHVVRRRYRAGLSNMKHLYLPLADTALIRDNSDKDGHVIAELIEVGRLKIYDMARWKVIEEAVT